MKYAVKRGAAVLAVPIVAWLAVVQQMKKVDDAALKNVDEWVKTL
jgi:hypothetical protein